MTIDCWTILVIELSNSNNLVLSLLVLKLLKKDLHIYIDHPEQYNAGCELPSLKIDTNIHINLTTSLKNEIQIQIGCFFVCLNYNMCEEGT